jgi:hypothetical protein
MRMCVHAMRVYVDMCVDQVDAEGEQRGEESGWGCTFSRARSVLACRRVVAQDETNGTDAKSDSTTAAHRLALDRHQPAHSLSQHNTYTLRVGPH